MDFAVVQAPSVNDGLSTFVAHSSEDHALFVRLRGRFLVLMWGRSTGRAKKS